MKIIHFISGGDTGGAKTHVLTLLTHLKKINVDVELLCIMESVFTDEAQAEGIPVTLIPQQKRYDITVLKKIITFINDAGCDVVHCHGARANYIALFIMHKVKVPMITTLHSDYKLDFKDTTYKQWIYTPINALALRRFRYILTVTYVFKQMLMDRGFQKERLLVIYNGVDFEEDRAFVDRKTFLETCDVPYDPSFLYVGIAARLKVVKNVDLFIRAAKIVCQRQPHVKFLLAGTGTDEEVEKYAKQIIDNQLVNNVYMLGHVDDMTSFYHAIDINTLTSLNESFPYSLLEGARLKKPTVSTMAGGVCEMIEDGKTGFLVPNGDAEIFAERLETLIADKALRDAMGNAFYEQANKSFSAKKMADTHKKIYEKITKENKK